MITKVISFRVASPEYAELLLKAEKKSLNLTDYILTKVYAAETDEMAANSAATDPELTITLKENIVLRRKIESLIETIDTAAIESGNQLAELQNINKDLKNEIESMNQTMISSDAAHNETISSLQRQTKSMKEDIEILRMAPAYFEHLYNTTQTKLYEADRNRSVLENENRKLKEELETLTITLSNRNRIRTTTKQNL